MQTYQMPDVQADVRDLIPESASAMALTPETPVLVIHRGRHVITDKHDGIDYRILPGYTRMRYGAARHFQGRQVIPGTRNPELGTEQSYLGIVGIDDAALCEPLTDDEVERYGAKVEAIDRDALTDPADRTVRVIKAPGGIVRRGGRRPEIDASTQVSEAAREAAEHIFERPEVNDAQAAAMEASAAADADAAEDADDAPRRGRGKK
jgi:hypothetical protein